MFDHTEASNEVTFDDFMKIEMRVGTVLSAKENLKAKKPAYVLEIDFGGSINVKTSSAQLTDNYSAQALLGRQIVAVTNFPSRRVAGVKSEVLVLGVMCSENGIVLLQPAQPVRNGERIA